jgi:hypothetical protein
MTPPSTSTRSTVHTITETAVYLTDVVMGTIADILGTLKIDITRLYKDWKQDSSAISAWIAERSLREVVLECRRPDGTVAPVIEFPVAYRSDGVGDVKFVADRAAMGRYRAKLDAVPAGTAYGIVCTFYRTPSDQPGWSPTTRASTDAMIAYAFGTLAYGPSASMSMRYLRRP